MGLNKNSVQLDVFHSSMASLDVFSGWTLYSIVIAALIVHSIGDWPSIDLPLPNEIWTYQVLGNELKPLYEPEGPLSQLPVGDEHGDNPQSTQSRILHHGLDEHTPSSWTWSMQHWLARGSLKDPGLECLRHCPMTTPQHKPRGLFTETHTRQSKAPLSSARPVSESLERYSDNPVPDDNQNVAGFFWR
ncbi:hypothetical protein MMC10_007613 [Thelotrema lepadinum]|nr:hypothetical protein [Thelotrema lepadinum]